jgi:hypothetical protein
MVMGSAHVAPARVRESVATRARPAPLPVIDDRRADRLSLHLPLSYTILLPGELLRGSTKTIDLSGAGLHFLVPRMVTPQTICQIDLHLPDAAEPLSFLARSAWCRQTRGWHRRSFDLGVTLSPADTYGDGTFARYSRFIAGHLLRRYLS